MSKLSVSWSYKLYTEAIACAQNDSFLAVLAVLPESCKAQERDDASGFILLFNAEDPVPVASWFVTKAKGGGLAFIQTSDGTPGPSLLAYVNGDHEYALFDPHGMEKYQRKVKNTDSLEGIGDFGYASVYGELPEFKMKAIEASAEAVMPSERPWETIFSGPSHSLPPLTKLCSTFLESLMEKQTTMIE